MINSISELVPQSTLICSIILKERSTDPSFLLELPQWLVTLCVLTLVNAGCRRAEALKLIIWHNGNRPADHVSADPERCAELNWSTVENETEAQTMTCVSFK